MVLAAVLRDAQGFALRPQDEVRLLPGIHRTVLRHQQRHDVLDLLDGQDLVRAEARHGRAGVYGVGIVDLLVQRLGVGRIEIADLAEIYLILETEKKLRYF